MNHTFRAVSQKHTIEIYIFENVTLITQLQ